MTRRSVIAAARRSAVMPRGGAFARLEVHDLAAPVIRALLRDADLAPDRVDELILSNALGGGGNPARVAALAAGLPLRVAGLSIDRQCCGGLDAIVQGDALIRAGLADIVIAGGAESYSRRPLRLRTDPDGGEARAYDRPPFTPWPDRDPEMVQAAEALTLRMGISRADQDDWAMASHARAIAARGRMRAEIVPVAGQEHDGFARIMQPRTCARAPVLAGSITAANTAVAADGAGFCLLMSADLARRRGLSGPVVLAGATVGDAPEWPGLAPVAAIGVALARAALRPAALDHVEIMEAFAVQAIACIRGAGLPESRVNAGGGALARGHPIGASGAVNAVRLVHEMRGRAGGPGAGETGLAAIAAAGGLGTALVLSS